MQQNIISLQTNHVPQTQWKKLWALKKRPLFKIKQLFFSFIRFSFTYSFFCSFLYIHLGRACQVAHSRLLKQCRPLNTNAPTAKLQLKSVHKQSVKLLIFFFLDFIQCHLCTTKISHLLLYFIFKKTEPHGTPQYCGSRRQNRPYKASV